MVYVIITLLLELQIIATHESEFCLLAIFLLFKNHLRRRELFDDETLCVLCIIVRVELAEQRNVEITLSSF